MRQNGYKVLIVDDERDFLETLGDGLKDHYSVYKSPDDVSAVELASRVKPQVVILDVNMPSRSGYEICQALRNNKMLTGSKILVTSAEDSVSRRVRAFECGADDFLPKPFTTQELIARIDSYIRRNLVQTEDEDGVLVCGNLLIDMSKMEVRVDSQRVPMSILEYNLIKYFVQNKEKVLTRDRILKDVWSDAVVTGRTVDTHIVSLRKKIRDADHAFYTIYGAGYVFKPAEQSISRDQ